MSRLFFAMIICCPLFLMGQFSDGIYVAPDRADSYFLSEAVDLDGDGSQDIIASYWNWNGSSRFFDTAWFSNDSNGNFTPKDTFPNSYLVGLARMDADSTVDVVLKNQDYLFYISNNGNGDFSDSTSIIAVNSEIDYGFYHEYSKDAILRDLDQDNDIDILYTDSANVTLNILFNDGRGNFERKIVSTQNPILGYRFALDIIDYNQDGHLDIIYGRSILSEVGVLLNDGDFNFSDIPIIIDPENGLFKCYDVNKDGLDDLITFTRTGYGRSHNFNYFKGSRTEGFVKENTFSALYDWERITLGDHDKDGDTDIFTIGVRNVSFYENDGNDNFIDRGNILHNVILHDGTSIGLVDLDNDSYLDLLYSSAGFASLIWQKNLLGASAILGSTYWDRDENGIFESDKDSKIRNAKVALNPNAPAFFTNDQGHFSFYVNSGIYDLSAEVDSCWEILNDPTTYNISVDGDTITDYDFRLRLVSDYKNATPRLRSSVTRCGFEVPFWLSIQNSGCRPINGYYGLVLDDLVEYIDTLRPPDIIRGDTLLWQYDEIISSEINQHRIILKIADADFIGDTINLLGLSYIENQEGILELANTYNYRSVIRCAYDPNDKLVRPNRSHEYDRNYTLFDEALEYTVRFQNTGNDTAFTVIIRDQLAENLDWTTFQPITASHKFETTLNKNGLAEFTFKNILLPDSTTNEALSHGFVSYQIKTQSALAENTAIANTANIYFDANPRITTNTTQNVMVSELPRITSTVNSFEDNNIKLYPNPTTNILTLEVNKGFHLEKVQFHFYNLTGQRIKTFQNQTKFDLSNFPTGIYITEVVSDGKLLGREKVIIQR